VEYSIFEPKKENSYNLGIALAAKLNSLQTLSIIADHENNKGDVRVRLWDVGRPLPPFGGDDKTDIVSRVDLAIHGDYLHGTIDDHAAAVCRGLPLSDVRVLDVHFTTYEDYDYFSVWLANFGFMQRLETI